MTLEEKIIHYQEKYYNDDPEITDPEFDALWDQLKTERPESELLKDIGNTSWDGWPKEKHNMLMGSQDKFNNEKDFRDWLRVKKIEFPIILEYKLDGLSVELQYENGIFTRAITRGDGSVGDLVTDNVVKMSGVPKYINSNFTGSVRGEIELKNAAFNKYFKDAKNPRNMASGITKRKDGTDSEHLSVIVYDAYTEVEDAFMTEFDKIDFLIENNFEVVPYFQCNLAEEILAYRNTIIDARDELDVAIDGIVLKQNTIVKSDAQRKRPGYQRAFKFEDTMKITILKDVEFRRNGMNYTPVGKFDPIELEGTTVSQASVHNIDNIEKLGLYIGCRILIKKAGQIIPQIVKVIE
ncbi:MAG: hypothetical protein PF693_21535 [Spirochaetia bacterium]|jgi:DNA ligase (NAD+)|nr:hypothetical protein [Spirochaetia bacterium]